MHPSVELRSIIKRFGGHLAVDDLSLAVQPGEFLTLLGPSGCGKTTTLRVVAGFERPTAGQVLIDGQEVTDRPPNRRQVNTVFQNYALFPHMAVAANVGFGLRMRRLAGPEIDRRVAEALEMVQLGDLGRRKPSQLSGGQQQRVALARALVNRPAVLLLDEPLGALDLKLRRAMQTELRHLNRSVGITFIYVTHDQEEALTMSDRIAVMRGGRILQLGTAQQIYEQPATRFVADFIGETSFLEGTLLGHADGLATVGLPAGTVVRARCTGTWAEGSAAAVAIRPERIALLPTADGPAEAGENGLEGRIEDAVFSGATIQYRVRLATGTTLLVRTPNSGTALAAGTPVAVRWAAAHCSVLAP